MDSIIIRTTARLMLPLLILFSIFLLIRGHQSPGGGFAGGLVAASAIILLALAGGLRSATNVLPLARARQLMAFGLLIAGLTAVFPLLLGQPLMKAQWGHWTLPIWGEFEIGTPVLFDIGVYIVVVGMTLTVVLRVMHQVEQTS